MIHSIFTQDLLRNPMGDDSSDAFAAIEVREPASIHATVNSPRSEGMSLGKTVSLRLLGASSVYGHEGTTTLVIQGGRICEENRIDNPGTDTLDMAGFHLFPGLINSHDHLGLDVFPPTAPLAPYRNGLAWGANVMARFGFDESLSRASKIPWETAFQWGGFLNLLHGVTTVQHHDPYAWRLFERHFPIRVLRRYLYSHTVQTGHWMRTRHALAKAIKAPYLLHAGEGTDDQARFEFHQLAEEGLLSPYTVLIHAVAAKQQEIDMIAAAGASVVWCPKSNLRILGRTAPVQDLLKAGVPVALGTDSRLTGSGGLLHELKVAHDTKTVAETELVKMVTTTPSAILRTARGSLSPGRVADVIAIPDRTGDPNLDLIRCGPEDLGLVFVGGEPQTGSTHFSALFKPKDRTHALASFKEGARWVPRTLIDTRHEVAKHLGFTPEP
jgi:cytosine/adenosine deaminase-related metal-dependent hydrolase